LQNEIVAEREKERREGEEGDGREGVKETSWVLLGLF
jgi:hypothetical protein